MYNPCSKNKGADQMCSYCTADLRLCFSHRRKSSFLITRLNCGKPYNNEKNTKFYHQITILFMQICDQILFTFFF